ncbi:MAG: addiction module antidote protein [Rhodocyclaceae bacterium]
MTEKFSRWDAADDLKTEEDIALYFAACTEEDPGDGSLIRAALNDISRARGMTQLAKDTGLSRDGLYTALSSEGNPSFATILKVMHALGLKLHGGPKLHA